MIVVLLAERFGDFIMDDGAGRLLGDEIGKALHNGEDVVLDFSGVNTVLTAFLNPAVGRLYADFSSDEVDRRVTASNASPSPDASLKRARDHARKYFNDPAYRAIRDAADQQDEAMFVV